MRHVATLSSEALGPEGAALAAWSPAGDVLAVAASRRKRVLLFDRAGAVLHTLTVPDPAAEFLYDEEAEAPVLVLSWHPAGGHLAVLPRGQSFAMVWSAEGGLARVDSGVKPEEVTALAWNPAAPQLALGTAKGGGLTYDLATRAATPLVLGRAAKPVCCMAWSPGAAPGGLLALGCRGGALLLCRAADGGLVRSVQLKAALSQLQFCELEGGPADRRCSSGSGGGGGSLPRAGALLAGNVGRRSVCIWQLPQALSAAEGGSGGGGDAFELAFREGYGELEAYTFVHPRLLVAAFSSGQVVAFSFNGVTPAGGLMPGTGTELFSQRCLQAPAAGLSWCSAAGTLAVGGGRQVALLSCRGQQVALEGDTADLGSALEPGAQRVAALHCCPDGRLLTVLSSTGRLAQLLARTPLLHGVWGAQVAFVDPSASPRQALLLSVDQPSAPVAHPLPVEPELLALGPGVLAASQGCMVYLQGTRPDPATGLLPPAEALEYPAALAWLRVGPACLALLGEGGQAFVQPLAASGVEGAVQLRDEDGEPCRAACAALTDHFLVLGLRDGTLAFYDAADCQLVHQYRHAGGAVAALFPSADGTLVLFQDEAGATFVYNAAGDELMPAPGFAGVLEAAVWDGDDPRVVAALNDAGTVHVFCHVPASVEGAGLKLVGTQAAPRRGAAPLALRAGMLTWHLPDGSLLPELLATHRHLAEGPTKGMRARSGSGKWPQLLAEAGAAAETAAAAMAREERLAAACQQALALCHFEQALAAARELGDPALLREVALAALQFLDLPAAVAAYEAAGDKAALAQLHPLLGEGDAGLVTGRVTALAGGDADRAEELLLASSRPAAAIEMRRDLGHWQRALELAERLEPHALGALSLLRAQGLEAEGQVEAARSAYQQALSAPDLTISSGVEGAEARRAEAQAGLARCHILLGDAERGMELAVAGGSADLLLQCAELLEAEQQPKQAGQLYAHAEQHERAARLFLACREFALLDGVMAHAGGPELWLQYAQAKEDLGSFADAARAYEEAGNVAAATRVLLDRLRDAEAAAQLAQRAGSADASLAVARYCERAGKPQLGVEQYCLAGDRAAAFALAKRAGCVPQLAAWARQARDGGAALMAAEFFEAQGQLAAAAELCAVAGKHERAVRLHLQAGSDGLAAAIRLAADCKDPAAAAVVLERLQAEDALGGALLDLHLALGNAEQACALAVARAQREQAGGNYKAARDQLLAVCRELQARGAPASPALLDTLRLLHSYLLVRTLVRQGDHLAAARLLLVVAEGIRAFPKHAVPILTSCVIECHRAGLHGAAQRWAAVLQQPQHAGQVSAAYRKKIEAIARQPAWTAERAAAEEPCCDCLFCGASGPESSLSCAACRRALPFCAASGRRMVLQDWSACPTCLFPARGRDLTRFASVERACPLCEAALEVHAVKRIFDPIAHMRRTVFAGLVPAGERGSGSGQAAQ